MALTPPLRPGVVVDLGGGPPDPGARAKAPVALPGILMPAYFDGPGPVCGCPGLAPSLALIPMPGRGP